MKPLAQQSLYEILEVAPDSSVGEIEAAYARARETYAPGSIVTYTLMSPEDAELLAARLDEARTTLLDPAARAAYDSRLGSQEEPAPSPWPPAFPPVIPALVLAPSSPDDEDDEDDAPAGDAVGRDGPAPAEAPPVARPEPMARPTPLPIRLEREIPAPARTPPPVRAPIPLHTPVPVASPPVAREAAVPDGTAWTGEVLRQLREARGISIQQISERTKVTRHHIENIEADRYGHLPAPVYLRGILLGIARELRLDGQKVARSYLERMAAAAGNAPGARR
ncbi:helix-turn-helix transcriptional regulator [Anaeromyxobacter sp. Fw109-5]|uniref:helix-turn-helix domain-containing protein n=1 Tax=Anaeromyxobacter sp. (strain Fw109-5) TaxID=404589 RepID=UPI000158A4AE|nr:helix-turn-helix transcriptional regulator [Anaeromyxobacter sp. Fw109-5]ABS26159.1 heat shock protein DnaJ domain protein [Anaeromyxobacter sp. Fw109-5]